MASVIISRVGLEVSTVQRLQPLNPYNMLPDINTNSKTHKVRYGYSKIAVTAANVHMLTLNAQIIVANQAPSFRALVPNLNHIWLTFSEPLTEPLKKRVVNGINDEPIPDFTWCDPVEKNGFRYYFTRGPRAVDGSAPLDFKTS